jgi:hypothetical protein
VHLSVHEIGSDRVWAHRRAPTFSARIGSVVLRVGLRASPKQMITPWTSSSL